MNEEERQCARCGRDLWVTKAVDKNGNQIAVPEHVICSRCLTSNEKAEVEAIRAKAEINEGGD